MNLVLLKRKKKFNKKQHLHFIKETTSIYMSVEYYVYVNNNLIYTHTHTQTKININNNFF